jgi:hypothetical protein
MPLRISGRHPNDDQSITHKIERSCFFWNYNPTKRRNSPAVAGISGGARPFSGTECRYCWPAAPRDGTADVRTQLNLDAVSPWQLITQYDLEDSAPSVQWRRRPEPVERLGPRDYASHGTSVIRTTVFHDAKYKVEPYMAIPEGFEIFPGSAPIS